jgi:pyrroloquinoline quinone biosynthesis protein B
LRESPIKSVVITSADIDQIAGLLSLRELQPFTIYCTASIRRILQGDNSTFAMLNRVPNQVSWVDLSPAQSFPVTKNDAQEAGISGSVFSLGTRYPAYVSSKCSSSLRPEEALLGLIVESAGKKLAYLPAVPQIDDLLLQRLESADLLLFDGTFWSDNELIQVQGSGPSAREMGHVPVSGPDGTLAKLAALKRPRKVFIHINNTNPMLDESSPEYRELRDAGWELAEDGQRFEL